MEGESARDGGEGRGGEGAGVELKGRRMEREKYERPNRGGPGEWEEREVEGAGEAELGEVMN